MILGGAGVRQSGRGVSWDWNGVAWLQAPFGEENLERQRHSVSLTKNIETVTNFMQHLHVLK